MNIIKEFKKYVSNFDLSEKMIKLKLDHSIRVMKISKKIVKSMNLSKQDIEIAILVGLLHDYARFEQWTKYKTFSDLKSIDHGDYAVELLFKNNDIEKFTLKKELYDIISNAIKYHNKYEYPENFEEHIKLHCGIIRDSDKLDIFHLHVKGDTVKLETCDEEFTKKVIKDFYNKNLVSYKDVKTKNDNILSLLSMIYDLEFKSSIKYLKNKNIIWKLYKKLNNREKYLEYFEFIDNYIKERLK